MSVAREHAERIAHLARLRIEGAELDRITADLNHILEHVEALSALGAAAGTEPARTDDTPSGRVAGGDGARAGDSPEWEGVTPVTPESTTRGEGAERPDALARGLATLAPDFREGFFVVPPLPGTRHEAGGA